MGKKSLKASAQGIKKAEESLIANGLTRKDIEARIICSRQPVSKFFNGEPISSGLFVKICQVLELNWEEIRENEQITQDIDTLVSEVRRKVKTDIVQRCGTMRVLDMQQPIGLNDIYTDVYILDKITANQRLEIDELNLDFNPDSDDFDRHWLSKRQKRVSGIKVVDKSPKVVILGKPGSGKTTFLKFLCLQCISEKFQPQRLPIFISLKEFAEVKKKSDLFTFIHEKMHNLSIEKDELIKILSFSRVLIVLDGLDEVNEEDSKRVVNEIESFSNTYSLSSLFDEDVKIHLEQREKLQALIKKLEKKTEKPNEIRKSLQKDYDLFENIKTRKQRIKTDIEELEKSNKLGKGEINKIKKYSDFLNRLYKDIQQAYKIIEYQEDINIQYEIEQSLNYIHEKSIQLEDLVNTEDKVELIKEFKQSLEKLQSEIEQFPAHPNYVVLKEKYEQQQQYCKDLATEIEQKKRELEEEYPDIDNIEKYKDRGLAFLSERFPNKIYQTHFIITCRTAALDFNFTHFTEVEISDFNDQQIKDFVHKWFHEKKDPIKENNFLLQLSSNETIKELASSPLLLTLLCLVFTEAGKFPENRSDLYLEGVKILLQKWDVERNIDRDQIYKNLTNNRKQDLLSQVASITFNRKSYFFKQTEAEKEIFTYIQKLPESKTDPEALKVDSGAILKSIEAQHGLLIERARGIYSFSHLTFQEYFTARKIVNTSNPKELEKSLRELAGHIKDKRWREVFLLAIGLLSDAGFLVQMMKEQVDSIVAVDRDLQELLTWANQRAICCQSSDKISAIRFSYLTLASQLMEITYKSPSNFLGKLIRTIDSQSLGEFISQSFLFDSKLSQAYYSPRNARYNSEFSMIVGKTNNDILKFYFNETWLNILKKPIPHPDNQAEFDTWWKSNGKIWTEQLNNFFNKPPKTITKFTLSSEKRDLLKQYFISNEFLLECMNTNCVMDREKRQNIEDNLFLPISEMDVQIG